MGNNYFAVVLVLFILLVIVGIGCTPCGNVGCCNTCC
ncbi:MAG: YjcZ family sporulation protein [Bacilli bacterium]|nr:YjcZ family sporulation protein [Bacilli bacterium]